MSTAPAIGSPEWASKVSASKVAAILGLSPWDSPRSMWHKMRGDLPSDDGNNADAKARGHYLESGILAWWRDQHPTAEGHVEQDWRGIDGWAGSTPDLTVADDGFGNLAVVDAKSAASDDHWGQPGTDEAPANYVAAAMWQMWTHGADIAYIAVLFGRPRLAFAEYVIQRDDDLIASIVARCKAFHDSLTDDTPPPLSDHVAEYEAVRRTHTAINREAVAILPDDLADRYLTDCAHEKRVKATAARVLDAMGDARLAKTSSGLIVARRQPKGDAVSLVRVAALPDLDALDADWSAA